MSARFADYQAASDYLMQSTDYERMRRVRYNADTFSLQRAAGLLAAVGNPQDHFRSVHVAGTKGKGSTAAMVEAILRRHGLRTGLFVSPHLVDLRERIQIDRQMVERDVMRRMVGRVAEAIDKSFHDDQPTFFEVMTAVGFLAFAEAAVDVAVIEVGLGGRLDSTNVVRPEVAVITGLSLDHVQQLGPDLASIAREKAGIAKAGVPLVVAPQEAEAEAVIAAVAAEVGARLIRICSETGSTCATVGLPDRGGRQPILARSDKPTVAHRLPSEVLFAWTKEFITEKPAGRLTVRTARAVYDNLLLSLAGRFQGANAACAVAAAEIVLGELTDAAKVRSALAEVEWPGRMEVFPGPVTVILDGAHNARSIAELCAAVADYYPGRRTVYLFAAAADKDVAGMCRELAKAGAAVVFTRTDNPRAADPEELAAALRAAGGSVLGTNPDIAAAFALAKSKAGNGGIVVATGSLYLVGALFERV
jgi:dihydrofolate synthase/folylpolyglutamate synthase